MLEIGYFSSLYAQFRLLIVAFKTPMGKGLCYGNVLKLPLVFNGKMRILQ